MTIQIVDWNALPQASWDTLLVGNGASIAIHQGFSYTSLYNVASTAGLLPSAGPIFASLGTTDFEHVLLACWHAELVNRAIGAPSRAITTAYAEVRDALIYAVQNTHCQHATLGQTLSNIGTFASSFDTVVTFNYDVTLYWAMLEFNNQHGTWFKDAFLRGTFDPSWQRLRSPYGATSTTMVFYGHGSLVLGRDIAGQETKLASNGTAPGWQTALLNTVTQAWQQGTHAPIFVSEGTATEKLRSIRRSPYLSTVYDQVLSHVGNAVVVYGLSFAPNDQHIIDALKRAPPKIMAISVYGGLSQTNQEAFCLEVSSKLKRHLPWTQLHFFNSQSSGCWNNP